MVDTIYFFFSLTTDQDDYAELCSLNPQDSLATSITSAATVEQLRPLVARLQELLSRDHLYLLRALLACQTSSGTDGIAEKMLVQLMVLAKKAVPVASICIRHEMEASHDEHSLLRGNTRAVKFFRFMHN